jgi:NAD(P) transhydrogenase subunit alpha
MGKLNLPGLLPVNASALYAKNLFAFVESMIDKESNALALNWDDELVKGTGIAKGGEIVNERVAEALKANPAKPATKPKTTTPETPKGGTT